MKKTLLPILACLLSVIASAQTDNLVKEKDPTVAVAFSLTPYMFNTAEIDLDIRLKERQWLTIAPRMQYGTSPDYYYMPMNTIKNGLGLGLIYRYFPLNRRSVVNSDGVGPFISGGLRGQATLYNYMGNRYVDYTDEYGIDGFYIVGDKSYEEWVSQLSVDICLGYSFRVFDVIYMEGFLGLASRISNYTYDERKGFDLSESAWDTGFSGYSMTGGIRVGIFLDKYTR